MATITVVAAAKGGLQQPLPLPDTLSPQHLCEWVIQRARPGGGGFGFLRTAQRWQLSQQETFSPQLLSELVSQRFVPSSVEAAALGASESAAAPGASESAAALGARASTATGLASAERTAPHSSDFPPTTAHLQTLFMDVWGPAPVSGMDQERYFMLVADDYTRYTTVFPSRRKADVSGVLIPWIRATRRQLRERFRRDLPVLRLHCDKGGDFSSGLLEEFCRDEGICQTFTLTTSPQRNGIAERRIGLIMEVARTSMIHAAAPHFLWPFAVRYVAHQLNLWPRVSEPETSPTLRWTGKVGDASVFRVWGALSLVRDAKASKLSSRTLCCVFLRFPTDALPWQFYHPRLRRVFSSQDVTFDESDCMSQVDPPPLVEPLEISSDSSGPAEGGDPAADNTAATRRSPRLKTPPGFPPRPSSPPLHPAAVDSGAETAGAEPGGAEIEGEGSGGAATGGAETGGAESGGAASPSSGGAVGDTAGVLVVEGTVVLVLELLVLEVLLALEVLLVLEVLGADGAGGTRASSPGGAGGAVGAGGAGGFAGGAGAGGAGGTAGARGAGAAGARGAAGAGGTGAASTAPRRRFLYSQPRSSLPPPDSVIRQVLSLPSSTRLTPPLLCPPTDQSQPQLLPGSLLPAPAPHTKVTESLIECREPETRASTPIRAHRVARPRPPAVPGTHSMALRPSSVPQCVVLPEPPASSLPNSESVCPSSVRGEPALRSDVLDDRQFELEYLAAALPRFASMLLCPEGDLDALDIPTPRSYAEVIAGEYSSQWQTAMDAEMASRKSTGTYIDEVPPPGANIVDGMWIFRVKRPPGSPPAFKARYVARGFSHRQRVDFFQTFSPTTKMTTLWVLLHVAAQRDYELHSLAFSIAFL
ncbi:unnamed protein product [Closterium sp. NIES-53]